MSRETLDELQLQCGYLRKPKLHISYRSRKLNNKKFPKMYLNIIIIIIIIIINIVQ
jgi:hypothetical protein